MTSKDKAVLDSIQMFKNTVNRFSKNRTSKADVIRAALYAYRDELAKQYTGYYSAHELDMMIYPDRHMNEEE
ncbi:MAG: hypothetical protein J6X26_00790 [Bacteroidales bacterium]|nr:hypothetical protein [Bacteroidales bacterium]